MGIVYGLAAARVVIVSELQVHCSARGDKF